MKKYITIPVGKISAIGTMLVGACTVGMVDNTLKNTECKSATAKEIGRYGANLLTAAPFTAIIINLWSAKNMNVKVKVPKFLRKKDVDEDVTSDSESASNDFSVSIPKELSEKDHTKALERLEKALSLWESILLDFRTLKEDGSLTGDLNEDIKKFNKLTEKLAKKVNFRREILPELPDDGLSGLVDGDYVDFILANSEVISNSLQECASILLKDEDLSDQSDDVEFITSDTPSRTANNGDVLEQVMRETAAEDLDFDDEDESIVETETNKFLKSIRNYFTDKDIDFDEVIGISDERAQQIMDRLRAGEISAVEACDLMVAALTDTGDDETPYTSAPDFSEEMDKKGK